MCACILEDTENIAGEVSADDDDDGMGTVSGDEGSGKDNGECDSYIRPINYSQMDLD